MTEDRDVADVRAVLVEAQESPPQWVGDVSIQDAAYDAMPALDRLAEYRDAADRLGAKLAAAERDRDRFRAALDSLRNVDYRAGAALATPEGKAEDE